MRYFVARRLGQIKQYNYANFKMIFFEKCYIDYVDFFILYKILFLVFYELDECKNDFSLYKVFSYFVFIGQIKLESN